MGALALEPHGSTPPAPQDPRHPSPFSPLTGGAASALYIWTGKHAPAKHAGVRATLQTLADGADPDGCNVWLSARQVAERSHQSRRNVLRHFALLKEHGVIRVAVDEHPPAYLNHIARTPGDPATRYEIMMPAEAFGDRLTEINRYRAERWGKEPITAESRPDLAPAPSTKRAAAPGVDRRRRTVRAAEAEAAALALEVPVPVEPVDQLEVFPLEALALEMPVPSVVRVVVDSAQAPPLTDEDAPPLEDDPAPRGDTVTPLAVTERHPEGDRVTLNPLTGTGLIDLRGPAPLAVVENVSGLKPDQMSENLPLAVGDQAQVVSGRPRAAYAGAPDSKRARGQATPRRPGGRRRRRRPVLWDVSAEAVDIYTACIPAAVKACIPDQAMGRILGAITAELARAAAALGCPAGDEVARLIAERAEAWRYRMPDADDPVAVVIGVIVRGGSARAPAVLPWCGACEGPTPARRFVTLDDGRVTWCPDCHPHTAPPPSAAAATHDALGGIHVDTV